MKILWTVNILMPELADHLGIPQTVFGGWLTGASRTVLQEGHELVVCTSTPDPALAGRYEIGRTVYYLVPDNGISPMRSAFGRILKEECPDLVHVYGTEYPHAWAVVSAADPDRTIITLQGVLTLCREQVRAGIPASVCRDRLLHKILRKLHKGGRSIDLQKESYRERAVWEMKCIRRARYINGLSDWGDAFVRSVNPDCRLLPCGNILRPCFYEEGSWEYDRCRKHSVYAVFTSPIKGFHKLLEAIVIVKRYYPDVMVYAAAKPDPYRDYGPVKSRIMDLAPDYEWYCQKLIDRFGLRENITYPGYLGAEQVREYLLASNVFVSASSIENQSTAIGEAMILGVPAVISCAGDALGMIRHGSEGYLYAFDQTQMLAYYICKLFGDPEKAGRISEKARSRAKDLFGIERNSRMLSDMYQEVYGAGCDKE